MANNAHQPDTTTHPFTASHHSSSAYPLPLPTLDTAAATGDAAFLFTADVDTAAAYSFLASDDFAFSCDGEADNSWMQLAA